MEIRDIFKTAAKYLLKERGIKQSKIAESLAMSVSSLNNYVNGTREGDEATRTKIANAIGLDYMHFMSLGRWILEGNDPKGWTPPIHTTGNLTLPLARIAGEAHQEANVSLVDLGSQRRVPVISWVQAGDFVDSHCQTTPGYADEWIDTSATSSNHAFALRVQGDSMEPEFLQDDIVVVDPDRSPLSASYIIAKNGDGEATFKQLIIDGGSVFLKPLNDRYPIKDVTGKEVHIVGVVVEKRKRYY